MELTKVMGNLNEKGISSALQWVFDGGFEMYLGDEANTVKASEWFIWKENVEEALEEAAMWLNAQAKEHYRDWVYLSRRGSDKSKLIEVMQRLYQRHSVVPRWLQGLAWARAQSHSGRAIVCCG